MSYPPAAPPTSCSTPLPSPTTLRALRFLHAWSDFGAGALTLDDLRPLFALAPRGELALTVDTLCRIEGLVLQEDGSFQIGAALPAIAPQRLRFESVRSS